MKLSATIITFNEETTIARAISSVAFVDEIIVIDSFSTDKTCTIAERMGARVIKHKFEGHGKQKNIAASFCRNDWILNIDADEEIDDTLQNAITKLFENDKFPNLKIFQLKRRTSFCGKWIYHGGWYPDFEKRLYNKNFAKWSEPKVHEELLGRTGEDIGNLEGQINHYSFPTAKSQINTNVKYAFWGAKELLKRNKSKPPLYKLFLKPPIKFLECYAFKLGFLDGLSGLIIAINASYSIFMKYLFAYMDNLDD